MANSYSEKINNRTYHVGVINGIRCKNLNLLDAELKEAFNWPGGEKGLEAMFNLEWIKEEHFKLIVEKFNVIKESKQKDLIKHEIESYLNFWNTENNAIEKFIVEFQ